MLQSTKLIFSIVANPDDPDTPVLVFQQFKTRAEAEGFIVEEHGCITNTTE